jgi:hypothetical protein
MPRGDGTGPAGLGPMTGRAAGFCAGYGAPGYMNPVGGRGMGAGWGRGLGFGRGFGRGLGRGFRAGWAGFRGVPAVHPAAVPYGAAPTAAQELDVLKGQARQFEEALEGIKSRIAELETDQQEA